MTRSNRILVVDDDPQCAAAQRMILASGGFEDIAVVRSAAAAFAELGLADDAADLPPAADVILLDVRMPALDGIEACARIRMTRRYRDVPIIMCSGLDETAALNQAFIAGANDYLTKPVRKIELLARVRSALRFKRELDRRRAREAELRRDPHDGAATRNKFIDPVTGLPNRVGFEVAAREAVATSRSHGLLALRIADMGLLQAEAGVEAAMDLTASVARVICTMQAPIDWKLYVMASDLFLIFAPGGSPEQLALLGKRAVAAIDALRIVHGHSLDHDFARVVFAADAARGTDLLTLPAELIRSLDDKAASALRPARRLRAA